MARLAFCLGMIALALGVHGNARAEQKLREMYGAAYSLAVDPRMSVQALAPDDPLAVGFGTLMPPDVGSLDVIKVGWPKSKEYIVLAVGRTGGGMGGFGGSAAAGPGTNIVAVQFGESGPRQVSLPAEQTQGALSRLCIWPEGSSSAGSLVLLMSFAAFEDDATVVAFSVRADGTVTVLDTNNARTLYGWFDVLDVDDDGSYELLTRRSLDGVPGGFFYRSIRAYDPGQRSYAPAPDNYQAWFQRELAWLDWVLLTREDILSNPAQYESKDPAGPRYSAEFEGQVYSFDSIIDQRLGTEGGSGSSGIAKALGYIQTYRNELAGWLGGAGYPKTWKLAR